MNNKRHRSAFFAIAIIVLMTALSYASVPFYRWFCAKVGFDGQPLRADPALIDSVVVDQKHSIEIFFDANTDPQLDWQFIPKQKSVITLLGERRLIYYQARNNTNHALTGHAVFNITPEKAAAYFVKIECFCFTEQRLEAGQIVDMPVYFYIDPEIANDVNLADVGQITLSYTFFLAK